MTIFVRSWCLKTVFVSQKTDALFEAAKLNDESAVAELLAAKVDPYEQNKVCLNDLDKPFLRSNELFL